MPDARGNKISCSNYQCEIELTVEILSGKWKALLIWNLHLKETIRYNEFRELEKYGIISRKTYPTVPPMVEYSLTEIGKELIPIMEAMDHWGKQYVKEYHKNKDDE